MFKVYDLRMAVNTGCPAIAEKDTLDEAVDFVWEYVEKEVKETEESRESISKHIIIKEGDLIWRQW